MKLGEMRPMKAPRMTVAQRATHRIGQVVAVAIVLGVSAVALGFLAWAGAWTWSHV